MSGDDIGIVRRMCEGGNGVFHDACLAVCDEVERLRAEVQEKRVDVGELIAQIVRRDDEIVRLRAAGDALATNYELMLEQDWSSFLEAFLHAWKEARRG